MNNKNTKIDIGNDPESQVPNLFKDRNLVLIIKNLGCFCVYLSVLVRTSVFFKSLSLEFPVNSQMVKFEITNHSRVDINCFLHVIYGLDGWALKLCVCSTLNVTNCLFYNIRLLDAWKLNTLLYMSHKFQCQVLHTSLVRKFLVAYPWSVKLWDNAQCIIDNTLGFMQEKGIEILLLPMVNTCNLWRCLLILYYLICHWYTPGFLFYWLLFPLTCCKIKLQNCSHKVKDIYDYWKWKRQFV